MPLVLIADDAAPFRRLLAARLVVQGFEVCEASDGVKALEAIRTYPVDLVVLDLQMPGVDGGEVLATMQADPVWRHIPVIVATALHERAASPYAQRPGVRAVLIKSTFGLKELIARVQEVLACPQADNSEAA